VRRVAVSRVVGSACRVCSGKIKKSKLELDRQDTFVLLLSCSWLLQWRRSWVVGGSGRCCCCQKGEAAERLTTGRHACASPHYLL
jgi:hypothetical protein